MILAKRSNPSRSPCLPNSAIHQIPKFLLASIFFATPLLFACSGPSAANIELRKQNQNLQSQVNQLQLDHSRDLAAMRQLQSNATTVPSLPTDRLDKLYTTAGLQFGRLTGGDRPDPNLPADNQLKVQIVPIDQQGDALKAAGDFRIELFDLALPAGNRIGTWEFPREAAAKQWFGKFLLYTYDFDCPWQTPPTHANLLVRVTFTEELTRRIFTAERNVTIQPPK